MLEIAAVTDEVLRICDFRVSPTIENEILKQSEEI